MIICEDISQTYPPGTEVLKAVSFKLRQGGFYFLTGASGAGKTTLLNVLSLNLRPSNGKLVMFGQDAMTLNKDILPLLRRRIGCVYQNYRLLDHLTVEDNIALPQKLMGMSQTRYHKKVEELLNWIHMEKYRHAYPSVLSGGEKQRVAIARAVINNPALIVADEPTGNLDPELSRKVMHLFEALNQQGATIMIATHDASLLKEFEHPVMELHHGKLLKDNT